MDKHVNVQSDVTDAVTMPNVVPTSAISSFKKIHNDFIRHPQQFPLEFKRVRAWRRSLRQQQLPKGDLGLSFVSPRYIATGTEMELSIPLRGIAQKFHGTVVMVRELADGFEIGIWLASEDEASRARVVEQICHIECYLQQKTRHGGELTQGSRAYRQNSARPSRPGSMPN